MGNIKSSFYHFPLAKNATNKGAQQNAEHLDRIYYLSDQI